MKTKRQIISFREQEEEPAPLYIRGDIVERVASFKLLGIYISRHLTWSLNTSHSVEKAQKWLVSFYRCSMESSLTCGIQLWYAICSVALKKTLQAVIKSAQKLTKTQLPSLEVIYRTECLRQAMRIIRHPSHPGPHLCCPLEGVTDLLRRALPGYGKASTWALF